MVLSDFSLCFLQQEGYPPHQVFWHIVAGQTKFRIEYQVNLQSLGRPQKNIIFIEPHFPLKMIPNPQSLSLEDDLIFQMTNNEIIEIPYV